MLGLGNIEHLKSNALNINIEALVRLRRYKYNESANNNALRINWEQYEKVLKAKMNK